MLEILGLENPAVTGEASDTGICSISLTVCASAADCDVGQGLCEAEGASFGVEDWSASLLVAPKNVLSGSDSAPFNDVILQTVRITYDWLDSSLSTPTRTVGLGNTTIPAGGTSSVIFAPVAFDDLSLDLAGRTANLTLEFTAKTVEGTTITDTAGRQLFVESCSL